MEVQLASRCLIEGMALSVAPILLATATNLAVRIHLFGFCETHPSCLSPFLSHPFSEPVPYLTSVLF